MAIETLRGMARAAGHGDMPMPKRSASAPFEGAAQGRRWRGNQATRLGPNQVSWQSIEVLKDRSRQAVRNNPHAANAINRWVSEAIGRGIRPLSQHPDTAIRTHLHDRFERWSRTCDVYGKLNFYGLQALAFRSVAEAGEVLSRFWLRSNKKAPIPLQLQLMEGDQLPIYMLTFNAKSGYDDVTAGNTVREGIEFTPEMEIAAYHIYREHPYDTSFFTSVAFETIRVAADDMVHVFNPLRPGQFRGIPWLTCVIAELYELEQYTDAALLAKKLTAMLVGFIETPDGADSQVFGEKNQGGDSHSDAFLEPGTLNYLRSGEKVTFTQPPTDANHDAFVADRLRSIAAGCGLTYELLTGDLRRVNMSSIRTGALAFRRACEQLQRNMFAFQFCQPVWNRFLLEGVLSGDLDLPGYEDDPYQYENVKWVTPGWPWMDPSKDIEAAKSAVRGGLGSRARFVAGQGEDVEEIDQEIAMDRDRAKSYGNVLDSDPTQVLIGRESNPTAPPPVETEEPDETDPDEESDDD